MIMKQLQKKSREDTGANSVAKYYQPLSLHSHVDTHCMRGQNFPPQKIFCTKLSWLDSERSEQKTDTDNKRKVISPSWLHTGQFCCNWCRLDIASLATFVSGLTRRQSYILRTKLTFRLIMLRVTLSMLDIASFATFQPIRGCFSLKSSSA